MTRLFDIPRSLAFYAAFYGGSVPIVLASVVLLLLALIPIAGVCLAMVTARLAVVRALRRML